MASDNPVEVGRLFRRIWSNNTPQNRESLIHALSTFSMPQSALVLAVAVMCDGMDMGERADFIAMLKNKVQL